MTTRTIKSAVRRRATAAKNAPNPVLLAGRSKRSNDAMRFLERLAGGALTFGGLLEAIRLGEALSLEAFANQLGISRQHLCDIERGRKGVRAKRAARFAKVLGYPPAQFVQLALQAEVEAAGLKGLNVRIDAA